MYYRKLQGGLVMMTFAGAVLLIAFLAIGAIDCFITKRYDVPRYDKDQLSWIEEYNKKKSW